MKKNYFLRGWNIILLVIICAFIFSTNLYGQSFSQSNLNFNGKGSISNGTSLMFGPDGRLYVAEYTGAIKIFTIQRTSGTDYKVLESEVLSDIASIQDHNDDGSLYSTTLRETTGLTVGGTATNPVIYVASSDFRIGGGGGGGSGDTNLDTNSGIITRFSWNGSSWDVVDIVRGLPRSEENHATNGMELATINGVNYLIVAQGGHTNAGAPSINFAYTTEYALSAAILSVNLDMINSLPIKIDNGRKYLYDLPTLDDPTRPNKNGITNPDIAGYDGVDINDPFGGNDGLNQAKIVPGGPVQIFSPGFRNCYDLVLTEAGAVYVTENGSNGGWGGFPVNEGGGNATNDYDPNEPGSTVSSGGEKVNNLDHLQLITPNIQNYSFGTFYGGHPTPVRANPFGAGLYTNPSKNGTTGAIFRTKKYHPTKNTGDFTNDPTIGLPADWPPVAVANPVEGDWRGPGIPNPDGPVDDIITTWGTNTNGIDEYTASNFNGAMKGNLIAGVNTGVLRRVELKPDGSLSKLTPSFVSGLGGDALGVTCNNDNDIFPGTIWVVTLNGKLIVLEPQDFGECKLPGDPGYDANADYDFDGYTNQDEEDNGTDPCNGGSQPNDFDKSNDGSNISDLNDLDDDADGILDENDPFQLGDPQESGSDAFLLPVINELFSSNTELGGYKGLGLTGIMNNGMPNPNWLNWLDRRDDPNDPNDNDILGGAIGAMTMQMTSGTAFGSSNSQEKGFQYGVQVNSNSGIFTVEGGIANFNGPVQLYGSNSPSNGELGFFIGDGTQSNYIKFVITPNGLVALQEVNDIPQTPISINIPVLERPDSSVSFYFVVNPSNGEVVFKYSFDAGVQVTAGIITAKGPILQSLQDANKDLAVGMIGTSNTVGVELEGTWDFLNVISDGPTIASELSDIERTVGVVTENISLLSYFEDNQGVENLTYSVSGNTNTAIGATISGSTLTISYPDSPAVSAITIRATDADSNFIEQSFSVSVIEEQVADEVLYRVNAGGPAITAIDGKLDWEQDTKANKSLYLTQAGMNNTYAGGMTSYNNEVDQATTPVSIYNTERYDSGSGAPNMTYAFPVDKAGMYEVRLYMGNSYSGTSAVGKRIFDISIEGVVNPSLDDIDLSSRFGHQVGGVIIKEVEVTDGLLEISFIHGAIENPLINGIEILGVASGVPSTPINVSAIEDQVNFEGDALD
ncbi:malectin domain-containing carbohydrate-binding protein, partial [Salegentibacter mishustinae]